MGYFVRMPTVVHADKLLGLAEIRSGYFTTAEAAQAGIPPRALAKMAERGVLERISHGVYRIKNYPLPEHSQYIEATLWPQGVTGVLSHDSALALHRLSDISPFKVHITIPRTHRVRRRNPSYLKIHRGKLTRQDVEMIDGILVTTPFRTIRDAQAAGVAPALIKQAIEAGRARGRLSRDEVRELVKTIKVEG
jgi:predicted transcriptional regulator of viral defense system